MSDFEMTMPFGHYVYLLHSRERVMYVGMTSNLAKRIGDHYASGKRFDRVTATKCRSLYAARELERSEIDRLQPPLNRTGKAKYTNSKLRDGSTYRSPEAMAGTR